MTDTELLHTMDYTRFDESCLDPTVVGGELVECRLPKLGHPDKLHATRKGAGILKWNKE